MKAAVENYVGEGLSSGHSPINPRDFLWASSMGSSFYIGDLKYGPLLCWWFILLLLYWVAKDSELGALIMGPQDLGTTPRTQGHESTDWTSGVLLWTPEVLVASGELLGRFD